MFRFINVLLLGASLTISVAAIAQDRDDRKENHEQQQSKRYYDKSSKDYHAWNQDEDRRYHDYLKEKHLKDRDFDKLKDRDRDAYFKWSHEHNSDHH